MRSLKHLGVPITSAEVILSARADTLAARERLSLVCTLAEYLHLACSLLTLLTLLQHTEPAARGSATVLTLLQHTEPAARGSATVLTLLQHTEPAARGSASPTVLAHDTAHVDRAAGHYVGLSWPVKCGAFPMLQEFIQVLQHINSHHLSQLLGYEIVGWRILSRGDYERKSPRRQCGRLMITPTPTLKPARITQRPAAGNAARPLPFTVPSHFLTPLVLSPTQSLSTFCGESTTMASDKMQKNIHLASQGSLVTLGMDSAQDMPANPPVSIMFADWNPDLSPSLITETRLLFTELEVLPTRAAGISFLLEQPEPHVPDTDSCFLSSKVSTYHFLQDITSGTEQLFRPMDTWVINTRQEWPHSSAVAFSPKTELHSLLPEATSVPEGPDYSNETKSHFPEPEMLSGACLSPETLPSLFQKASVRATTWSDSTSPIDDMLPPVVARSSLSQVFSDGYEPQSFMTIPQPNGFLLAGGKSTVSSGAQRDAQTLYSKWIFSPEAPASFAHTLSSTVPSKAEASEPSLIILSHPDTTPVLTVPEDFSTFHMSGLSRPTNTLPPYSSSMLRTETPSTSILCSGTKELHPDKDLGTSGILPNVTEPTLESHIISGIMSDAAEAPLVTLFNATSHLPSSTMEVAETLLPSHQDPSTWLFPTSERLVESAQILPPFSVSQELQTITQAADTFYDEEDGNSTRLSPHVLPADGSPAGSESWLQFDTSQQAMHGYPLEVDFQYSPQEFVLSATDSRGLAARESLTTELLRPSTAPCHLCTVRTKNSYSSFLRERRRVGLFLEKLSLFLSSSSPKGIAVMALRPGSTLISWYNSSLCPGPNASSSGRCRNEQTQEVLGKLRVPAGSVSPHFIQAMLPEYNIDVAFSISYSEHCSATTEPLPGPVSSTGPTLQARNNSTVRKSPPASLSTLCATSGVLLVLLVSWLCKCHRRIPGSQCVLFQRNSQLSHANVELDVLRPRKAPVHECRAPPSPPPWIPPSGPVPSQQQCPRAVPLPHITPPFQPPKYQLPPCHPEGLTSHHDQGNIQRLWF